jgi:hypothetical protein
MSGKIGILAGLGQLPKWLLLTPVFAVVLAGSAFGTYRLMSNKSAVPDPEISQVGSGADRFGRVCDGDGKCIGADGAVWVCTIGEDGSTTCVSEAGMTCASLAGLNVEKCVDAMEDNWYCALNATLASYECMRDDGARTCQVDGGQLECRETRDDGTVEICTATDIMNTERCRTESGDGASSGAADPNGDGPNDGSSSEEQICVWGTGSNRKICGENGEAPATEPLVVGVHYSTILPTAGNVYVTITANKAITAPNGWQQVSESVMAKVFNDNATETVRVAAGSEGVEARIVITNINKDLPVEADNVPPQVYVNYSTTSLTNKDVVVTIRANEEIKLVDGWARASGILVNEMSKTFAENTIETIRVEDMAGNVTEMTVMVSNIDKTPPVISNVRYSTTELTKDNVTVTFEASEEIVTPDGWEYRLNAQRYTRTFTTNWSGNITVRDLAGNTATVAISVANIDKTPLTLKMIKYDPVFNSSSGKLASVTVVVEANKNIGGMSGWTGLSETTWSKVFTANADETITVSDRVGNVVTYKLRMVGVGEHAGVYEATPPTLTKQ